MKGRIGCAIAVLAGCASSGVRVPSRPPVLRDVTGYATAVCFAEQNEPLLQEQGDGWAEAIVQRGAGDVELLAPVQAAVEAAIANGHMAYGHKENPPMTTYAMPVLYCSEIIDEPGVHAAIQKAVTALEPDYKIAAERRNDW